VFFFIEVTLQGIKYFLDKKTIKKGMGCGRPRMGKKLVVGSALITVFDVY